MLAGADVPCLLTADFSSQKQVKRRNLPLECPERSGRGGFALSWQPAFPGEGMGDDGVEVLELRTPIERRTDAPDVGHQRRRIARPPAGDLDRKVAAAGALDRLDHLEHRRAVPIA